MTALNMVIQRRVFNFQNSKSRYIDTYCSIRVTSRWFSVWTHVPQAKEIDNCPPPPVPSFPSSQRNRQLPPPVPPTPIPRARWTWPWRSGSTTLTCVHLVGKSSVNRKERLSNTMSVSLCTRVSPQKNMERQAADLSCFGLHGAW